MRKQCLNDCCEVQQGIGQRLAGLWRRIGSIVMPNRHFLGRLGRSVAPMLAVGATLAGVCSASSPVFTSTPPATTFYEGHYYVAFGDNQNDTLNVGVMTTWFDGLDYINIPWAHIEPGSSPALALWGSLIVLAYEEAGTHKLKILENNAPLYAAGDKLADGFIDLSPVNVTTGSGPSLLVVKDTMYIAFKANDSSQRLYLITSNNDQDFQNYQGFDVYMGSAPTLTYEPTNGLWVGFEGVGTNTLYLANIGPGNYFTAVPFPDVHLDSAPAMLTFGGGNLKISYSLNSKMYTAELAWYAVIASLNYGPISFNQEWANGFVAIKGSPAYAMDGSSVFASANGRLSIYDAAYQVVGVVGEGHPYP